jgi:hypothetical protein
MPAGSLAAFGHSTNPWKPRRSTTGNTPHRLASAAGRVRQRGRPGFQAPPWRRLALGPKTRTWPLPPAVSGPSHRHGAAPVSARAFIGEGRQLRRTTKPPPPIDTTSDKYERASRPRPRTSGRRSIAQLVRQVMPRARALAIGNKSVRSHFKTAQQGIGARGWRVGASHFDRY